jgi:cytochrome c553
MKQKHVAALAVGLLAAASAAAQDRDLGRNVAATCANCHGTDGKARDATPVLAGVPAEKLLQSLADFRSGKLPATIMHQIVKGYTDEQLRLAAAYFAQQK